MSEIPELTPEQVARGIEASVRRRLMLGEFETGEDVAALRRFVGLSQTQFAQAIGISVHTLRNWEQGRRRPEGPAVALLRIAARHPRIIRENVLSALEAVAGWQTARVQRPVLVLGGLDGIPTGIRQLRRTAPLEVELPSYRGLVAPWTRWEHVVERGRHFATVLLRNLLGGADS